MKNFAKGIITKPATRHICYCLTPPRFLWDNSQKFVDDFGLPWIIRKASLPLLTYMRIWDAQAADRVDQWWAISKFVQSRVKKYYHSDSKLIYPPVSVDQFKIAPSHEDYFLMVGRLVSYKKFHLAIEAFNQLGWPLKIAGSGPEISKLKNIAKKNIQFLGSVSQSDLADYYAKAKALIFPQEEDFGIVPLEAMASGRPVIAYKGGGALETIVDGKTGLFFDEQTTESLMEVLRKFDSYKFDPQECRRQAEKFDVEVFKKNILANL